MTLFKRIVFIFFKIIVSIMFILLIAYYNGILVALKTNYGIQLALYQLLSLLLIILFIIFPFIKEKIFNRILWILFFVWLFLIKLFPDIKNSFAIDTCLDTGICTDGLEINTEYGLVKINKENCIKYNWKWENGYCDVNDR